jgi:hypothetical protein
VFENQKYQFEIYLLESVLQSFLTDGPGPQRLSQLRFNANETRLLILKEKPHDWLFMLGMEE